MIFRKFALAGAVVLATGVAARADAIDGQWCFASSSLEIQGPRIRTPGGNEISGNYSRHGFSYVVPANEPGSGSDVVMVLLSEETLSLTRGAAAPETWRRCKPTS
jgi:hypothetical protein